MNPQKRLEIFKRFKAQNPKPTTELKYHTPFELLVAVILSAQTTDVSVNKATVQLFDQAHTAQDMIKLGLEGLKKYVKTINLYPTKSKNIIKACEILIEKYNGQVPNSREQLEELPGVGRKTANVILNTTFGQPTIAVDTHIFRVANRINLATGKTPREVEDKLLKVIPKEYIHDAHHWLILHGRYVCTAKKPKCPTCIINDLCEYKHKTVE